MQSTKITGSIVCLLILKIEVFLKVKLIFCKAQKHFYYFIMDANKSFCKVKKELFKVYDY